jgi:hypothetical protein
MNGSAQIQEHMQALVRLLAPRCRDRTTMDALALMISDESSWPRAHDLFDSIRRKTLSAERSENPKLASQYLFEEICAKTLFNLSLPDAPFDADSPYWVVPIAIALARDVGLSDTQVIAIVAA